MDVAHVTKVWRRTVGTPVLRIGVTFKNIGLVSLRPVSAETVIHCPPVGALKSDLQPSEYWKVIGRATHPVVADEVELEPGEGETYWHDIELPSDADVIQVHSIITCDGRDPMVLAAALLHDTIEDTETTQKELARHFGPLVAGVVAEVTDDKSLEKAERKRLQIEHAASISKRARLVKLVDRIANVQDVLESPPTEWSLKRRQEYFDWSKAVVDRLGDVNRPLQLRFWKLYRRRPRQ